MRAIGRFGERKIIETANGLSSGRRVAGALRCPAVRWRCERAPAERRAPIGGWHSSFKHEWAIDSHRAPVATIAANRPIAPAELLGVR